MSNSFDLIYIFSQVFEEKFRYEQKYREIYLDKSFNIFDYPVGIRKIFYKYHHTLARSYNGNFKEAYPNERLEKDILKDDELVCIPMEFISEEEISKRSFGKLLSQDYNFIHLKDDVERNHYTFDQIVHYDANVLDTIPTYNMNYYIRKGMCGFSMFDSLPRFVEYLDEDLLINYINDNNSYKLEDEVLLRFYNKGENKMILYENLTNKAKDNIMGLILSKYHNVPNNLYEVGDEFPSIILHYKTHSATINIMNFLTKYFIHLIANDTYKYDFVLVPKNSYHDNDVYIVDNVHGRYVYDIRNTKAYQVVCAIKNMTIDKTKLDSIELLESIYPKEENLDIVVNEEDDIHIHYEIDMKVFNDMLNKFDIHNPQIYEFCIKYATIPWLLRTLGRRTINNLNVLKMRYEKERNSNIFNLYSLDIPEIVNYIASHASDKYIMDNFSLHMINDKNILMKKSYKIFKYFNYYNNELMDYMLEHDVKNVGKSTDGETIGKDVVENVVENVVDNTEKKPLEELMQNVEEKEEKPSDDLEDDKGEDSEKDSESDSESDFDEDDTIEKKCENVINVNIKCKKPISYSLVSITSSQLPMSDAIDAAASYLADAENSKDNFTDWVCERYLIESKLIPEKMSEKFVVAFVTKYIDNYPQLDKLFLQQKDLIHKILEISPDYVDYWFCNEIDRKSINKLNFEDMFNEYYMNRALPENSRHGFEWIKTYHEEPPLKIYMSPNHNVDGETNSRIWSRCVNAFTIPKEMTSMNYYEYMVKTNGKRRDPDATVMYSFFSNSLENKIIFCRSDVEFTEPAVCRYTIPVDFSLVKPYLHEELETNGICMFCKVSEDDWDKIAGGRKNADIVCFSDCKNIYRERNPLKNVITYIINMIQDKFDKEVIPVE